MRTCPSCQHDVDEGSDSCPSCGSKLFEVVSSKVPPPWPSENGNEEQGGFPSRNAKLSLILGLASVIFLFITAIPAVILGYRELKAIKKGKASKNGKRCAQVGVATGLIALAISLLALTGNINRGGGGRVGSSWLQKCYKTCYVYKQLALEARDTNQTNYLGGEEYYMVEYGKCKEECEDADSQRQRRLKKAYE